MKATLLSRLQWRKSFLAIVAGMLVGCLVAMPAALAAGDDSTATKEKASAEQKDKKADDSAKKEKSDGDAAKKKDEGEHAKNGKAEHKDASTSEKRKDGEKSVDAAKAKSEEKSKSASDTKEKAKDSKPEKVRLAMVTLKDSLPETAEQAGPFGENKLDMREVISATGKSGQGQIGLRRHPRYSEPDDRPRQGRRTARRDQPFPQERQESVRHARIRPSRRITSWPARAMRS